MGKLSESVRTNVITWLLVFIMAGFFGVAQTTNNQAKKTVKVVNDANIILKAKQDSLARQQKVDRKDIDTILRAIPQIHESVDEVKLDVAEIKGMIKILVQRGEGKTPLPSD